MREVEVLRSRRKTLSARIREGKIEVRAPLGTTDAEIRLFLEKHRAWLEKHLLEARALEQAKAGMRRLSRAEIKLLKEKAMKVIPERAAYFAPLIGVTYGRISVRCQKTRWGSCSAKGDLSFNCLLMLAPAGVIDSIVVHELCHRKVMNHSGRFYAEVLRVMPDYRQHRDWLKEHGEMLLAMAETTSKDGNGYD